MSVQVTVDDRILVQMIRDLKRQGNPLYIVADGVEYGVYQELGTRYMPGKHFMRNAVDRVRAWFIKRWNERTLTMADENVRQAAFMVEGEAKAGAPVDTGALKASIHVVKGGEYRYEVPG